MLSKLAISDGAPFFYLTLLWLWFIPLCSWQFGSVYDPTNHQRTKKTTLPHDYHTYLLIFFEPLKLIQLINTQTKSTLQTYLSDKNSCIILSIQFRP